MPRLASGVPGVPGGPGGTPPRPSDRAGEISALDEWLPWPFWIKVPLSRFRKWDVALSCHGDPTYPTKPEIHEIESFDDVYEWATLLETSESQWTRIWEILLRHGTYPAISIYRRSTQIARITGVFRVSLDSFSKTYVHATCV